MERILVRCIGILFILAAVASVEAQETNPWQQTPTPPPVQAPPPKPRKKVPPPQPVSSMKPPDMACFGEGPDWSMQFVSWGARYVGTNQPDQDFLGGLFWVPDEKVWLWQKGRGDALSAKIQKASCTERKGTFPYAAVVYLPNGDVLGGCCRKLKAGEAPAGPHGLASNNTPSQ